MFAVWLMGSRECINVAEFDEGSTFAILLVPRGGGHGVYSPQSDILRGYGDVSTLCFQPVQIIYV